MSRKSFVASDFLKEMGRKSFVASDFLKEMGRKSLWRAISSRK